MPTEQEIQAQVEVYIKSTQLALQPLTLYLTQLLADSDRVGLMFVMRNVMALCHQVGERSGIMEAIEGRRHLDS